MAAKSNKLLALLVSGLGILAVSLVSLFGFTYANCTFMEILRYNSGDNLGPQWQTGPALECTKEVWITYGKWVGIEFKETADGMAGITR